MRYLTILMLFLLGSCDKANDATTSGDSKLLGQRLIAEHGEGFIPAVVLSVYDSGFMVGSGSVDPEFSAKVEKLGLKPGSSLSAGIPPVDVREYYSQEGVEFGVSSADKVIAVDSTSSLTIRLLFGPQGITALRSCEAIKLDRVCKSNGELRGYLDDVAPTGAELIDGGQSVGKGEFKSGWVIFQDAPDVSDDAQLELMIGGGVRCNLSKWLVDPRDSCTM